MTSLAAWLADQIAEAARPIAHRITADTLSRIRIDITVRLRMEDAPMHTVSAADSHAAVQAI